MFRYLLLSSLFFLFLKGFPQSNLHYVDPSIGGVGIILEPTRPVVHLPNSMLRVFPQRRDQLDDQIHNFPLTLTSHRRHLAFAFLPLSGERGPEMWNIRLTYFQERLIQILYPKNTRAQRTKCGCWPVSGNKTKKYPSNMEFLLSVLNKRKETC